MFALQIERLQTSIQTLCRSANLWEKSWTMFRYVQLRVIEMWGQGFMWRIPIMAVFRGGGIFSPPPCVIHPPYVILLSSAPPPPPYPKFVTPPPSQNFCLQHQLTSSQYLETVVQKTSYPNTVRLAIHVYIGCEYH